MASDSPSRSPSPQCHVAVSFENAENVLPVDKLAPILARVVFDHLHPVPEKQDSSPVESGGGSQP